MKKIIKQYENGIITQYEATGSLVQLLTEENLQEFLELIPADELERIKEHAFSDKEIRCFGMEMTREESEKNTKEYSRGLKVLRNYWEEQ